MRLAVVGSGYVGTVAAACFAELGHDVISVDNDPQKLAALKRGESPIHEQYLPELIARHHGKRLTFTDDLRGAVATCQAIFIAVGTPASASGEADLSYVESVARETAAAVCDYHVIVEKSTVPVYTNAWIRRVMLLNGAPEATFDVASNPEFLREGTAVTDFLYPDRVVIGADSARCAALLRDIYAPLTDGGYYQRADAVPCPAEGNRSPRLITTSAKSAELIKHASNAFLAMKISFINAVATVCESVGADVEEVVRGMGSDSRIGPRFLRPGIGYGGSCFPKDLKAFRAVAQECNYDFRLLDEVMRINETQRQLFVRKVRNALWTLRGKRLGVLGLSFKGGTDDIRESPAIELVRAFASEGCDVVAFDPAATARAREVLSGANVSFAADSYSAAKDADALLILTDWTEFATLDLSRLKSALRYPIVIDGRNLYIPEQMAEAGFHYYSVGRADAHPAHVAAAAHLVK